MFICSKCWYSSLSVDSSRTPCWCVKNMQICRYCLTAYPDLQQPWFLTQLLIWIGERKQFGIYWTCNVIDQLKYCLINFKLIYESVDILFLFLAKKEIILRITRTRNVLPWETTNQLFDDYNTFVVHLQYICNIFGVWQL